MNHVELLIQELVYTLHGSRPQPHLWQGSAARACDAEIAAVIEDLEKLRCALWTFPQWQG